MTDIQAWRRSAQLSRPRANDVPERPDLIPDPTLSGNASLSTSPVDSTRPRAKKSLASFSALLNTNRAISSTGTPRWPSIDWSNLNDNDEVYKPDIDFMLSTLQHFCLANPSQDLPARYSGPLLHVLEAFRQLKADNESLKSGMEEQIRCHQDDLDRLHCVFISLWGKKLCRLPHQAHAKSFMEDTESLTQLPARKDEACCKKEQAGPGDRLEEGEVQPLLSEQKTLPTNGKGMMALASGSYHVGMPRKLSTSGMESDLLSAQGDQLLWSTVQDTKGAKGYSSPEMHLAEWLASRVGCSLDEAQFELTQILRSFPHWLMQLGDREALPNALANSPSECVAAMTQQMAGVQERQTNNARNKSSVSSMTRRGQGHRRGFSFLPGDDSVKTMLPRTKEATESGDLVSTPLPGCQNRESGCDNVSETSKDISTPRLPPSSKAYQQSIKSVVAPAVQTAATQFQRDDCSKGILSTIRRSSGRSSTSSRRDSASSNIEPSSLRATKISGNNHFAIAAARAAKVSQTTRTAIDTSI